MTLAMPGIEVHWDSSNRDCARMLSVSEYHEKLLGRNRPSAPVLWTHNMESVHVEIVSTPCTVTLCGAVGPCHEEHTEELERLEK